MYYAAGVLVCSWFKGKLYTLLGKDHYNTYSDFGGKCDICDHNNPINTASREMYEETTGCLLSITEISTMLSKSSYINTLSYTDKPYYMYIIFIRYDDKIIDKHKEVYTYIRGIHRLLLYTEKTELKWFHFDDVIKEKIELRNIFKRTIQKHKNSILKIAYKYISTNTKYIYG